jgi:hypothetical protein
MWIVLVGGLMITLPAIIVIFALFGTQAMIPALASFCINMLPFIAAYFLMRKQAKEGNVDLGH